MKSSYNYYTCVTAEATTIVGSLSLLEDADDLTSETSQTPPKLSPVSRQTVSSESGSAVRGVSGLSSSVTVAAVSSKFIHSSIYIKSTGLLLCNYAHIFLLFM